MKDTEKLADEIRIAIETLSEIRERFDDFMGRNSRGVEDALLFGRYVELYYGRIETVFLHVKNMFGNDVETEAWHKGLLYAMTRDTSYRRRVISDSTYHALDELRGFRHFVRYNYRLDNYDWDRMELIAAMLRKSHETIVPECGGFIEYLESLERREDSDA